VCVCVCVCVHFKLHFTKKPRQKRALVSQLCRASAAINLNARDTHRAPDTGCPTPPPPLPSQQENSQVRQELKPSSKQEQGTLNPKHVQHKTPDFVDYCVHFSRLCCKFGTLSLNMLLSKTSNVDGFLTLLQKGLYYFFKKIFFFLSLPTHCNHTKCHCALHS
jgi:hypothetical protein